MPYGFCALLLQIVKFLERVNNDGIASLYRKDLMKDTAIPPLPAGLTCAAALPPKAWHLVPDPYNKVWSPEEFEEMYTSCMDPNTGVFDMALFQKKCAAELKRARKEERFVTKSTNVIGSDVNCTASSNSRNIYTSSRHWTVISRAKTPLKHPFTPPKPYTCKNLLTTDGTIMQPILCKLRTHIHRFSVP